MNTFIIKDQCLGIKILFLLTLFFFSFYDQIKLNFKIDLNKNNFFPGWEKNKKFKEKHSKLFEYLKICWFLGKFAVFYKVFCFCF